MLAIEEAELEDQEVAEADGEDEAAVGSDFETFNEKLRAAAPNEFAWVIMDPSRENTPTNLKNKCANVEPGACVVGQARPSRRRSRWPWRRP